jgi:gamma-glutamylcysteine synthetase
MCDPTDPAKRVNKEVSSVTTNTLELSFPTAASINKWNDQMDASQNTLGTAAGTAAGLAGAGVGLHPIADAGIGIAVDGLVNNMPAVEINFNPGDKIVISTTAITVRSTSSTEGDNGIVYNTSITAVSSKGVQTSIYNNSNFLPLNPITYDSHNAAMKAQENSQNSKTVVTNPNYNQLHFKLIRTN